MAITAFVRQSRIRGDKFSITPQNPVGCNRPLLVKVREIVEDFKSELYPTPKPVVFVDVVDLYGKTDDWNPTIYVSTLWGGGAVVDQLRPYVGQDAELPVMAVIATPVGRGNPYTILNPLEGGHLDIAVKWLEAFPTAIDDARKAREAEAGVKAAPVAQVQPQAPTAPSIAPARPAAAPPAPAQAAPAANGMPATPFPSPAPTAAPAATPEEVAAALAKINAGN